jgi:hypothetical protein
VARAPARARAFGAASPTARHSRSASGRCAGHRGSSTRTRLGRERSCCRRRRMARRCHIAGIDLGWSFGRQGAVVELLPDQHLHTWAVHDGGLAQCLRRPIVELAAAFSAAIDSQPSKSHDVVANACSGYSVNLSRSALRADVISRGRHHGVEPPTVKSRCQPKEPRRGWHRAGTSGLP